jgi:hypothetical protein
MVIQTDGQLMQHDTDQGINFFGGVAASYFDGQPIAKSRKTSSRTTFRGYLDF